MPRQRSGKRCRADFLECMKRQRAASPLILLLIKVLVRRYMEQSPRYCSSDRANSDYDVEDEYKD